MSLLPDVNFDDVPDNSLIEKGTYYLSPVKWEIKPTANKLGEILWISFCIVHGKEKNSQFSYNYNSRNKNPEAVRIAMIDLKKLLRACGLKGDIGKLTNEILDGILGVNFIADVTIDVNPGGDDRNKLTKPRLIDDLAPKKDPVEKVMKKKDMETGAPPSDGATGEDLNTSVNQDEDLTDDDVPF